MSGLTELLKKVGLTALFTGVSIGILGESCNLTQYYFTNNQLENKNLSCSCVKKKIDSLAEDNLASFVYGTYGIKKAYLGYYKTNCESK